MSQPSISELLASSEGKTLEFKRDLSSLKQIIKTVIAFANTAGGTLVIGRNDDGSIPGIDDPLTDTERLANAISDSISPHILPEIDIASAKGKSFLTVRVAHWPGPFYLKAEGSEQGVYIRLGSTNRQAGPEYLAELIRIRRNISFDQLPCPELTIESLDLDFARKQFSGVGRAIDEEQLLSLGILTPYAGKHVVTNGGLIMFGKTAYRERIFPDARVSCARFRGIDKVEFIDRFDVEGTLLNAVEEVPKFIKRNTRLYPKITSFQRQDISAYPKLAVREVLVNALAHADFSLNGMRILVSIFTDRMEIQNPGILPFGMILDDFKSGVSKIRNRIIARTFRELNLMEEWGSGFKRVIDACRQGGYPEPVWQEVGPAFRVTFYPHPEAQEQLGNVPANVPVNVPVNKRQEWFLEQLRDGKNCKASDLATQWQVTEKTAKRDIADLKKKQLIVFSGAPKIGQYSIKAEQKAP